MKKIIVANLKCFLPVFEEVSYLLKLISSLALRKETEVIICPSMLVLPLVAPAFKNSGLFLGAQNCSPIASGASTGESCARDLVSLGCTYVLIGHYERKSVCNEEWEITSMRCEQATSAGLVPIVCLSEETIEKPEMVSPLLAKASKLLLAYEPSKSIGAAALPSLESIQKGIEKIEALNYSSRFPILYGGSVTAENVLSLKEVSSISGFLIGRSSTNFSEFEKLIQ